MRLVYGRLSVRGSAHVLLDGGLFLPGGISQETIIRGDEKIPVIAAASIIAKVTRDRIMARIHKNYPQYRFDLHKGYGTEHPIQEYLEKLRENRVLPLKNLTVQYRNKTVSIGGLVSSIQKITS